MLNLYLLGPVLDCVVVCEMENGMFSKVSGIAAVGVPALRGRRAIARSQKR